MRLNRDSTDLEPCNSTEVGRFTVRNINIEFPEDSDNSTHSNILIVDHLTKEVEFFEPNGSRFYTYSPMFEFLKERVGKGPTSYQVINFQQLANLEEGPQIKVDLPICVSFSLLYVYLRLRHPIESRERLVQEMTRIPPEELKKVMSNFLSYEVQLANRYSLFQLNELKFKTYKFLIDIYEIWEREETRLLAEEVEFSVRKLITEVYKLRCQFAQLLAEIIRSSTDYSIAQTFTDQLESLKEEILSSEVN